MVTAPDRLDAGREIGPEVDPRVTARPLYQDAQGRPIRQRAEVERLAAAVGVPGRGRLVGQVALGVTQERVRTAKVDRVLLQKYDRIRTVRRDGAIFPLRGPSCGHCDTSVPMQRRNVMAAKGTIEVCETCGVLMYAGT